MNIDKNRRKTKSKNIAVLSPDKITIKIGDAHIYEEHICAVKTQLSRIPVEFPVLKINCNKKDNINNYEIDDFLLENYNPASTIKAKMIA